MDEASWTTGSGKALPEVSGSTGCSEGFVVSCISGGGGEPPPTGLTGLRLGERDGLRFLSRFAGDLLRGDGDLLRGDGDLVFRLAREANLTGLHVVQGVWIHFIYWSQNKKKSHLLGLFD